MRSCLLVGAFAVVFPLAMGMPRSALADTDPNQTIAARCPAAMAWHKAHAQEHKPPAVTKPTDPALRKQLLAMVKVDQDVRHAWMKAGIQNSHNPVIPRMLAVDAANLKQLKPIIAAQGFPTPAMVGNDGVEAAFLLVQHADSDPAFQARVLPKLAALQKKGMVSGENFAMLTDRVLRAQHKPQRYGTQFATDHDHPGTVAVQPMEDPMHIDARRASVGMMPLDDYACVLSVVYKTPVSVKPSAGAGGMPH